MEPVVAERSMPRFTTIDASALAAPSFKLDAKHYQDEFVAALSLLGRSACPTVPLKQIADAIVPARIKLVTSKTAQTGARYLKAHGAFELRPETERRLVESRIPGVEAFKLKKGHILTPSSGRNLGPVVYVGEYLSKFAMTDIMRIVPRSEEDGYFLFAYLLTETAQALLRRGRTGTNVDHLAPAEAESVQVIWPDPVTRKKIAELVKEAEGVLDQARATLDACEAELHVEAGLPPMPPAGTYISEAVRGFSHAASALTLRLDAAYYDPRVRAIRQQVGGENPLHLDDVCTLRMLGRYKRYYVSAPHGRPILSGRQLLQIRPVGLKRISDRSFDDPTSFVLSEGWSVFTCDGRSEEALGSPGYVTARVDGWMASNHIMRAVPKAPWHPGFVYSLLRSPYVQAQLKASATGSVIDALDPETVGNVIVPRIDLGKATSIGTRVVSAWAQVDEYYEKLESAVGMVTACLLAKKPD